MNLTSITSQNTDKEWSYFLHIVLDNFDLCYHFVERIVQKKVCIYRSSDWQYISL